MNTEPPIVRLQVEHQPRRPGYAGRSRTRNIFSSAAVESVGQ